MYIVYRYLVKSGPYRKTDLRGSIHVLCDFPSAHEWYSYYRYIMIYHDTLWGTHVRLSIFNLTSNNPILQITLSIHTLHICADTLHKELELVQKFLALTVSSYDFVCLPFGGFVCMFVLGRCSYSSRGTDLVSSVGVPLGGALKK